MEPHLLPCHSSLPNLNIPNENLETKVAILLLRDVMMEISVKQYSLLYHQYVKQTLIINAIFDG
jgi:hypothetical protein